MKILIIGSGSREEALCWKFLNSKIFRDASDARIYLWPKKSSAFEQVDLFPCPQDANNQTLAKRANDLAIELCVCGPEGPLDAGIKEAFAFHKIRLFGPSGGAAKLESSKSFAKSVMSAANIPTANYKIAKSPESCRELAYMEFGNSGSVVLKADGLASGKGVFVCKSEAEIENALSELYLPILHEASQQVLVEECLQGRECSYFSLINPSNRFSLGFAVDFKRLEVGDHGPNTGGMGCYTPVPWLSDQAQRQVEEIIIGPLLSVLQDYNLEYEGFLYIGLMWTDYGPRVIEFNVRLGDPEAQVLVVQDKRDWLFMIANGCGYEQTELDTQEQTVAVVMTSKSYARKRTSESLIERKISAEKVRATDSVKVFAGALAKDSCGNFAPQNGRVLSVVGKASTFRAARELAYQRCDEITLDWPEAYWRSDIAARVTVDES